MDFHALPRRDLQALCKRNGVRANMTNAAMADALGALPTVDGIDEYVKQPAAMHSPADKATVAAEEVRREKQGSPLPRGRRITAKTSEEVVKADEGEGKEDEKAEDAPPHGAVRRGGGRRARPAPAAAAAVPETQGKPLPRARRAMLKSSEPTKKNGGDKDEKMEANHESRKEEDAPAIGVGRRCASRRTRLAPAVATAEAEPAQAIVEDLKLEAYKEDTPAQGGVRRGPSRRARPAPIVSKPAAKSTVAEELGSPQPRGRRVTVNVKSSVPIRTEEVPPLGVGRRGVSRRAQPEPAVSAPVAEVEAEADEPDDGEEEDTAHGVVPRGPSQRTRLAPVEAPATRRWAAASTTEERNVTAETALICPTSQRRPTMKAAAAEEMVPRRTIKKAAARNSALQQGKEQEEPLGTISDAVVVPSLSCVKYCNDPENVVQNKVIGEPNQEDKEVAANQDEGLMEQNVTLETVPIRPTRQRRPTMKAVAPEENVLQKAMKKVVARNSSLQKGQDELLCEKSAISDAVFVPTLASDTGCNYPENMEKVADPRNKVQNEVIDEPKQDDDEELVMNEDEMLMEENPSEVAPVTDQQYADRLPLQGQQVDVKHCATPLLSQDDSPILGLVSTTDGQVVEENGAGTSDGLLEKGVSEEIHHADEKMELGAVIQTLRTPLTTDESIEKSGFTGHAAHNEMENPDEVLRGKDEINQVDSEDGHICQEKGDVIGCEVLLELMDETIALDCSGYISPVAEKGGVETMVSQSSETSAIDDFVFPVTVIEGEVVMDKSEELVAKEDAEGKKFLADLVRVHEQMGVVTLEKAENVSDKLPHNTATTDEDIEENEMENPDGVLQGKDEINQVDSEDGHICQEKGDGIGCEVLLELMDETIALDCLGYISPVAEKGGVETMVSQSLETEAVIDGIVSPVTVIEGEVVMDMAEGLVAKEDVEGKKFLADLVRVHEQMGVVTLEKAENVSDKLQHNTATTDEDIEENEMENPDEVLQGKDEINQVDSEDGHICQEKGDGIGCEVLLELMDETIALDFLGYISPVAEKGGVETMVSQSLETEAVIDGIVSPVTVIKGEVVMDMAEGLVAKEDVEEKKFHADLVRVHEQIEVVNLKKAEKVSDRLPHNTATTDEDIEENDFRTDFLHVDELKEVAGMEKVEMVTDPQPKSTAIVDVDVQEVTETEDEDVRYESASTGDLPHELDIARDSSDNVNSELLDNVIKSLSSINIHKPTVSQDKDIPMPNNSSENSSDMNTDEPLCTIKSESSNAVPVAMEENMGLNMAKKSEDLNKLSLGQLKARLKKKLKHKEAKRVALARVDENICRSNATAQEQVRKLQQ